MKPSKMPPRRVRLRRLTPLRAMSPKRRRQARAQRVVAAAVLERDGGLCLLRNTFGVPECFGVATPHHLVKQSQQGDDSLENEVTLCSFHNGWVEDHPDHARALGLVKRKPLPVVPSFPRTAP